MVRARPAHTLGVHCAYWAVGCVGLRAYTKKCATWLMRRSRIYNHEQPSPSPDLPPSPPPSTHQLGRLRHRRHRRAAVAPTPQRSSGGMVSVGPRTASVGPRGEASQVWVPAFQNLITGVPACNYATAGARSATAPPGIGRRDFSKVFFIIHRSEKSRGRLCSLTSQF